MWIKGRGKISCHLRDTDNCGHVPLNVTGRTGFSRVSIQITLIRVQPEIQAYATWIIDA